jgi:uncharacterized membrane protein HdeD (DUF308 family)
VPTADPQTAGDPSGPASETQILSESPAGMPGWLTVAYGVVTALLGVAVVIWPKATVLIIVLLVVVQLIVSACYQLFWSLRSGLTGLERALLAIGGTIALLIALLLLRRPLQTIVIMTMLIGLWWIVRGILDLFQATAVHGPLRGWTLLLGVVTPIAGLIVLLNPEISLRVFVAVAGLWMILSGILIACTPLLARRHT